MSQVCTLFTLLAIAILGSQSGYSSEMKIEDGIPSSAQQTEEDHHEKIKYEKVKAGVYRDLKWYRQVKLSALDYVYPDYAKKAAVLYKYEPASFIDVVTWEDFFDEVKSAHLVFADVKEGEYKISPDSMEIVMYLIDYTQTVDGQEFQLDNINEMLDKINEMVSMKVLLSTVPDILDITHIGEVVSWNTGVPVATISYND